MRGMSGPDNWESGLEASAGASVTASTLWVVAGFVLPAPQQPLRTASIVAAREKTGFHTLYISSAGPLFDVVSTLDTSN